MIELKTRQRQTMQRHGGALRLKLCRAPISHGNLTLDRCVVGPAQIRRVEKLALQLATNLMHGARAGHVAIGERMRDRVQKWIAQVDRQRPGGGHHGIELGIGEANGRHGKRPRWACALRGVAQGCAVLRFVSFVLAPVRLAPGDLFSDRRLRRARSLKLADGPARTPSVRRPLLDERTRNVRPLVVRAFGGLALEKLARALTMEKIRLLRPFEFLTPKIVQFRALFRCQQPRGIQGRLFLIIAWIPYRRLKLPPRRRPSTVPVPREQAIAIADPGVPLLPASRKASQRGSGPYWSVMS